MRAWHFSENAYHLLPDAKEYDSIRVTLPNRYYDPKIGADLYHRYIDEWVIAEDLGLEIMLNEHHQTATNLNPAAPIILGILARETKKARLLLLGNPITNRRDPVRVAEEMAMVDVYSRGRLECGFVRGVPYELSAGNHRPTHMMERFWEAHDLILKAWTSHDGPFNWEGKYFHHRQVNIWPRPYQQPHPPVWITALSPDSARQVAERGAVVASFLTGFDGTRAVFESYRARRAELGLAAPPRDRFAYAALVYTGETDAEGLAGRAKTHVVCRGEQSSDAIYQPARVSSSRRDRENNEDSRRRRYFQDVSEPQTGRVHGTGVSVRWKPGLRLSADHENASPCRRLRSPADHGTGGFS